MNVIERIQMLKKMVKEVEKITSWQETIYTALHNIHADWVVSGIFALARIPHHHATHEPGGVDEVTGVIPGAHKDSHDPEDGSDPLDAAAPVKVGAANAEGSSHSFARADHVHEREHAKYTDAEVDTRIAAKIKAATVTDNTDVNGQIAVVFAAAFPSTPIVTVQIEGDVDYYPVMISKSTTGFTVKILKTAHAHTNPNTSADSAGTPAGSISSDSAGTPAGTIGAEAAHTHGISFTSGAGSSHRHTNPSTGYEDLGGHSHTQGVTGVPSATTGIITYLYDESTKYCASVSGGSPTIPFFAAASKGTFNAGEYNHTHTNPSTNTTDLGTHRHSIASSGYESSHTHTVSGTSGAGSSHNHSFTGSALGDHGHTFSGSALGTHSHTQGATGSSTAGNTLASTSVTFSYIAVAI